MTELYAALLKLKADGSAPISPTQGYHAYAMFLALIQQSSPGLAAELHRSESLKPFTVSPLQGKFERAGKDLRVFGGSEYSIRLTFLREDVFAHFMDATLNAANQPLRLESALFHIDHVVLHHQDSPLCHHQSYEGLFTESAPDRKVRLQFLSPTTFRSGGKRNVVFPDPTLVFGGYLAKWEFFSPIKTNQNVTGLLERIMVARYKLNTHILHFDSYRETGFEGDCTFEVPEDFSHDALRLINTLADFAFYCGTGAKTTMGMGQSRRVK